MPAMVDTGSARPRLDHLVASGDGRQAGTERPLHSQSTQRIYIRCQRVRPGQVT